MRSFTDTEQQIIDRVRDAGGFAEFLKTVPAEYRLFKCHTCKHIVDSNPCPNCGATEGLVPLCPLDHCHCFHEVIPTISYCPVCGEADCPECGSHDVVQISRVTGYLQEVSGWNIAKQQELKDRQRYNIS